MPDEAAAAGTLIIGPLSTVEEADEAACALLGYSKSELVGLHGSELVRREDRAAVAAAIDRLRHGDFAFVVPGIVKRKDGSVLSVDVGAQRLPNNRLALTVRAQRARVST
jgi:PAS domain S-box-containing protein